MSGIVRLKPFVSSGEVVMRDDGSVDVCPIQVIKLSGGVGTVIRIGRSTLWFQHDGTFDGVEMKLTEGSSKEFTDMLAQRLDECRHNRGKKPGEAYFDAGSKAGKAEAEGWPKE